MRHPVIIPLLIALSIPVSAFAQCTLIRDCIAATGAGGRRTQSGLSSGECQRLKTQGAAYGGCTYTCNCTGGSDGGSSTGGPAISAKDQMMLDMSYQFGVAIGKSLFGDRKQTPEQEAERERQSQEDLQREREAQEQRRQRFESEKVELTGQLKGQASSGELGLKGQLKDAGDLALKTDDFNQKEAERREAFADTADEWCRLHPPLEPLKPFVQITDDQYERMSAYYHQRKSEFDARCRDAEAKALAPESVEKAAASNLESKAGSEAKGKEKTTPLPISCSSCWRNFNDEDAAGCGALETYNERLVCVNGALDKWTLCIGGCRTEPHEPVKP